jgi:hypothetical protein
MPRQRWQRHPILNARKVRALAGREVWKIIVWDGRIKSKINNRQSSIVALFIGGCFYCPSVERLQKCGGEGQAGTLAPVRM